MNIGGNSSSGRMLLKQQREREFAFEYISCSHFGKGCQQLTAGNGASRQRFVVILTSNFCFSLPSPSAVAYWIIFDFNTYIHYLYY